MKSKNNIRNNYRLQNNLSNFFKIYKKIIIICAIVFLVGMFTGIFTVVKYSENITIENIFDNNLKFLLEGDRGTFGLFFSYLLTLSITLICIIFLNFKPWMVIFTYIPLFIMGYVVGYNITIVIILFSFAGVLNALLILLPLDLLITFFIIVIAAIAMKRNYYYKKYGCLPQNNKNIARTYLILIGITLLFLLLKCILMPLIRVTIII